MKTNLKIHIVDDDEKFLTALSKTLENEGYSVSVALNPKRSLEALIGSPHHIVIINCFLCSEKGTDLVHQISSILGDSVDIALMSSILKKEDVKNLNIKNVQFLNKPINKAELDAVIKKTQNRMAYGTSDNLLSKFFQIDVLDNDLLKILFNIQKADSLKFLLTLARMLNTGETGSIKFSFDSQSYHELFFEKGKIVNYISYNNEDILNELLNKNYLDIKHRNKLNSINPEELDHEIVAQGYVAPNNISEAKDILFNKLFSNILNKKDIKIESKIFKSSHHFFEKDQVTLIEKILSLIEKDSTSELESLFSGDIMGDSIVFRNENILKDFENAKSEISLKELSSYKNFENKKKFYLFVLRNLLTFQAHLESAQDKYSYIKNRFKSLHDYCSGKDPKFVISLLVQSELPGLPSPDVIKRIHSNFLKFNHPDRFPHDLPKDVKEYIDSFFRLVKQSHHDFTDPKAQMIAKEKAKKEEMRRNIEKAEQLKRAQSLLESMNYKKAYDIILKQDEEDVNESVDWQLLYLWSVYKMNNEAQIASDKAKQYFGKIIKETANAKDKTLYFYISGLRHAYFNKNQEAISSFKKVKMADPSFKPVIQDLRDSILKSKKTKKSPSLFSKLKAVSKK